MSAGLKYDPISYRFCWGCDAELTSADNERGRCTTCDHVLPPLRRLLIKIGAGYIDDPGTSDLDDSQPVDVQGLDLGDVRLAWRLLR